MSLKRPIINLSNYSPVLEVVFSCCMLSDGAGMTLVSGVRYHVTARSSMKMVSKRPASDFLSNRISKCGLDGVHPEW